MLIEDVLGGLLGVCTPGMGDCYDMLGVKAMDGLNNPLPRKESCFLELGQTNDRAELPKAPGPVYDRKDHLILAATEARRHEGVEDVVCYLPVVPFLLRVNF
ncbi:hypothetical protein ES703_72750 [subsurface metagenome]